MSANTKSNPHSLMFDSRWFRHYQRALVMLLNHPATKDLMRWCMRIHHFDCGRDEYICQIMPNRYTVLLGRDDKVLHLRTDFRTHDKYAKRMYEAFKLFWWVFHAWDLQIANRLVPAWNLGFDSLTVYPNAHTESTSVDGWAADVANDKAWADMQDEPGNRAGDTDTYGIVTKIGASATTNQYESIYRGIFLFDTSGLTASATLSAAVMSLYSARGSSDLSGTNDICVYSSTPASNTAVASGDFDSLGTTELSDVVAEATWVASEAYRAFTLNASGKAAVSLTGVTKLGVRNHTHDAHNSAPGWVSRYTMYLSAYFADNTGDTKDPKLVITYTLPSAGLMANPLDTGGGMM